MYFLIAILIMSITACQKDEGPINPSGSEPRIKTETYNGEVAIYTYDERGRMIHEAYPDSSKNIFLYYPGYFVEKQYDSQGNLTNQKHFELNTDSLAELMISTTQPGRETRFDYDTQRRLIKSISTEPNYSFVARYYYGPEGNQDSVSFSQDGVWLYTWENTYLDHQPNMYTKKVYGKIYFGEESTNLLAGALCRFPNPLNNFSYQYDYSFDSQGRIITMIESNSKGTSDQYDFTY